MEVWFITNIINPFKCTHGWFKHSRCCYLVTKLCLTLLWLHGLAHHGLSVHEISQARILEWVAITFSGGSSQPRNWTHVYWISCTGRQMLYHCATREILSLLLVIINLIINCSGMELLCVNSLSILEPWFTVFIFFSDLISLNFFFPSHLFSSGFLIKYMPYHLMFPPQITEVLIISFAVFLFNSVCFGLILWFYCFVFKFTDYLPLQHLISSLLQIKLSPLLYWDFQFMNTICFSIHLGPWLLQSKFCVF